MTTIPGGWSETNGAQLGLPAAIVSCLTDMRSVGSKPGRELHRFDGPKAIPLLTFNPMNRLLEFVQEDNGGFSSTRLAFLVWAFAVLVVWIVASVTSQPMALARIDPSVTTILGILMTGKVVQKFGEKPDTTAPGTPDPGAGTSSSPKTAATPANPAPSNPLP